MSINEFNKEKLSETEFVYSLINRNNEVLLEDTTCENLRKCCLNVYCEKNLEYIFFLS